MIARLAQRELRTRFGTFLEILYYDGRSESVALVMGDVAGEENVLCRIHSSCISAHVFNSTECTCREEMEISQSMIEKEGRGIVIWLDQEGKGNGHLALMKSIPFKIKGYNQGEAYEKAGYAADARSFRAAADILADLNVASVILLTNDPGKIAEMQKSAVTVAGIKEISTARSKF